MRETLAEACSEVVATYSLLQSTSVVPDLDCNANGLHAGSLGENTPWDMDGSHRGSKTV